MNKKILLLATATLLLVACEKESKEVENNKPEALTQTDVVNFYLSSCALWAEPARGAAAPL